MAPKTYNCRWGPQTGRSALARGLQIRRENGKRPTAATGGGCALPRRPLGRPGRNSSYWCLLPPFAREWPRSAGGEGGGGGLSCSCPPLARTRSKPVCHGPRPACIWPSGRDPCPSMSFCRLYLTVVAALCSRLAASQWLPPFLRGPMPVLPTPAHLAR
jgi:hypothetical protein